MKLRVLGFILSTLLLLQVGSAAHTNSKIAPGRYVQRMNVGGFSRSYILRVPRIYNPAIRTPLVIVLHGWTASATMAEQYTRMADESERAGFIMVAPDGLGDPQGWNAGFIDLSGKHADEAQFITAIIDHVETQANIDPDRVFIAGHSNGAFLANLLGAELSNRVAAIASVAGTIGVPKREGGFRTIPEPAGPVSVLLIHGKKDRMVRYDSHSYALLNGIGAVDSAKWWATHLGCQSRPVETVSQNGNVITDTYQGGRKGTEVTLVSIVNGAHDWPGGLTRDGAETTTHVNAAELVWNFFATHPKQH